MPPAQFGLTESAKRYYDSKQDDRNLRLSHTDGGSYVNHHFGIGNVDPAINLSDLPQEEIARIIHGLELQQTGCLIDHMGLVLPTHQVLDAGSGRGGTSLKLVDMFDAKVHGITISPYQARFSQTLAQNTNRKQLVQFYLMNMLRMSFRDKFFDHVVTNETTMYFDNLVPLFKEFIRVLTPKGRYTLATWCYDEDLSDYEAYVNPINVHYGTSMNSKGSYLTALKASGFRNIRVDDLTQDAIPYWEIRSLWEERTGIEESYLEGHRTRRILYLMISADNLMRNSDTT